MRQLKASSWIRILTPMRSPDDPIVKDVNYEHMPLHWAPKQVWFAKKQTDYIGDMRSLVRDRFTQYTADAMMVQACDNECPKQYIAEWILLSTFDEAQIPVENIPQAVDPINLSEVATPTTPSSMEDDSPRARI